MTNFYKDTTNVITTAEDFYTYIGKPVGSKFRMRVASNHNLNFGGDSADTNAI